MTENLTTTKIPPYNFKEGGEHYGRRWYWDYALILFSAILVACGLVFFIVPFKIVAGGVLGVAILINQLSDFPIGLIALSLNIPLVLWGIRVLGANFGLKTVTAMVLMSLFIDLLQEVLQVPALTKDVLVGSVFGGVLVGMGIALAIRANATTGGSDIVAQVMAKYTKVAVGKLFLIIDGLIVLSGILVFRDIDSAPYAVITIFAVSRTVDFMLAGFDNRKAVFIVSDLHEHIREFILNDLNRTGTYFDGKGLYFKENEKQVILTAISRKELVRLQRYIATIDKRAFVMVLNTNEVYGSGFRSLLE